MEGLRYFTAAFKKEISQVFFRHNCVVGNIPVSNESYLANSEDSESFNYQRSIIHSQRTS